MVDPIANGADTGIPMQLVGAGTAGLSPGGRHRARLADLDLPVT